MQPGRAVSLAVSLLVTKSQTRLPSAHSEGCRSAVHPVQARMHACIEQRYHTVRADRAGQGSCPGQMLHVISAIGHVIYGHLCHLCQSIDTTTWLAAILAWD